MAKTKQSRRRERATEPKDDLDQATIDLARVTRVMAGGKRMRFRAAVAVGDKAGHVGLGVAKGADVALAMAKAGHQARKNLTTIKMTADGTIPHQTRIKLGSARLLLKPAPPGTGIIAGSVLRQIFELAGVRNVVGKVLGSANKISNARAVICALADMKPPRVRMSNQDQNPI